MKTAIDLKEYYNKKYIVSSIIIVSLLVVCYAYFNRIDYSMTVDEFSSEYYKLGPKDFTEKYSNKRIELTGKVIDKGQFKDSNKLYMNIYINEQAKFVILAMFAPDNMNKLNNEKTGDLIKIQGVFSWINYANEGWTVLMLDSAQIR